MPFINIKITNESSEDQNQQLKTKLGKAITLLPGKSQSSLMIGIQSSSILYFKGNNTEHMAFAEVKLLGKSTREAYTALTAEICKILNEIYGISGENVFVKFEEIENWGMNGFLF